MNSDPLWLLLAVIVLLIQVMCIDLAIRHEAWTIVFFLCVAIALVGLSLASMLHSFKL